MKKVLFLFSLCAAILFTACRPETVPPRATSHSLNYPAWLKQKIADTPPCEPVIDDFAQADTPERRETLAYTIQRDLMRINRDIPIEVCRDLAGKNYDSQKLEAIRSLYFYDSPADRGADEVIKTRIVKDNKWHYYSTPGIYLYLVTHLNTVIPEGKDASINYNTVGISESKITFADITTAGKALDNTETSDLFVFDPDYSDFHYYTGTSDPIIYSGWAFEMIYYEDVEFDGTVYPGPFGSQDGSLVNYPFMFSTPANETFTFTPDLPDFPLYDALWYFPIQGLGAVYVLGEDY